MPDHARTADSADRQVSADGDYFAPLALSRYMRITTFNRHGIPVSASVPGVADGDRAYFRARNRSGTVQRLRHTDAVQATPCGALGFFTYGPPLDATTRQLSGDEARLAAAKLDSGHPLRLRFPARLLRRQAVYYELAAVEEGGDEDAPADAPAPVSIRLHIRQEASCADASAPTSLATVPAIGDVPPAGPQADHPRQRGAARR